MRNWDYRFCWLRDATLTLLAMLDGRLPRRGAGVAPVAAARGRGRPGRRADHVRHRRRAAARRARARLAARLRGLAAGAGRQRRLRAAPARRLRRGARRALPDPRARRRRRTTTSGRCCCKLLEWLEDGLAAARTPASGRCAGPNRHFTHSKVMAWVAFDRAVRFHEEFGREGPVERWRALRDEIHARGARAGLERGASRRSRSPTARTSSTRACC